MTRLFIIFSLAVMTVFTLPACNGGESTTDGGFGDSGMDASTADSGLQCKDPASWPEIALAADMTHKKGPYLMYTTPDSIIVKWETESSGASVVEYGDTPSLGKKATGVDSIIHEVKLTGLKPDTRYYYKAGNGTLMSGVLDAKTAPLPGVPFRFAAYGDSQDHPEIHSKLVELIAKQGVSFVAHTGDLEGDGRVYDEWEIKYFGPTRPLGHKIPYFSAIGNHEHQSHWWYDFFAYPYPAGDQLHMRYYSYTWGDAFFVHLDGDMYIGTDVDPQHEFVKKAFSSPAAKKAKYRIAVFHQAAYADYSGSNCDFEGDFKIRANLIPLLEEKGVQLILNGHTHMYQRMTLNGIKHVITGGGGGGLEEPPPCKDFPWVEKLVIAHHFTMVEVGCDMIKVRPIDVDGNEIDYFEIPANVLAK
jgi:predicted phosphodiesterase